MDWNTLLFYKLNKYQNKLEKYPNSVIYQQKYAYYKDLIGGGDKWITFNDTQKSVTVKNYLKKDKITDNTPTNVKLYFTEEEYGKVSKIKEKIKKKEIDSEYSVDKYKVNNIKYIKDIVYERTGTTSSPPYDLCLKKMIITFKNGEIPKIILDYIKSNTKVIKYIKDHFVTADFLQHQSTKTNKNCEELEKKLEESPIKA
jgi:hypothetical protein